MSMSLEKFQKSDLPSLLLAAWQGANENQAEEVFDLPRIVKNWEIFSCHFGWSVCMHWHVLSYIGCFLADWIRIFTGMNCWPFRLFCCCMLHDFSK